MNNDEGVLELGPEVDGRSFAPLLRGELAEIERALFWQFPHHGAA